MPDYAILPTLAKELGVSVAELLEGKKSGVIPYFLKETAYMENYIILFMAARKENAGEIFFEKEKQNIVTTLLNGIACKEDIKKYKLLMRVNPVTEIIVQRENVW